MWKLTISQKQKNTYLKDGKECSYESEQNVSYESENLGVLLIMISNSEQFEPGNTKYQIERVNENVKAV